MKIKFFNSLQSLTNKVTRVLWTPKWLKPFKLSYVMANTIQEESLAGIETRRDWSWHFVRWPVDPGKTGGVRRQTGLLEPRVCVSFSSTYSAVRVQKINCQYAWELGLFMLNERSSERKPEGRFVRGAPRCNGIQVHCNIQQSEMKTCPAGTH